MPAAKAEKPLLNVISLFGTQPEVDEEEIPVGISNQRPTALRSAAQSASILDLTDKPKVGLRSGAEKRARRLFFASRRKRRRRQAGRPCWLTWTGRTRR